MKFICNVQIVRKGFQFGGYLFNIRIAVQDDIPAICTELQAFSDFYKTKLPPYRDTETSAEILSSFIKDHLFYVAEIDNELVGFICGLVTKHVYNPDILCLCEAFWWVKPEYRKSGVGKLLLDQYEAWGKANVDWILMTVEEDFPIDENLFLSRGFRKKETSYILEVV